MRQKLTEILNNKKALTFFIFLIFAAGWLLRKTHSTLSPQQKYLASNPTQPSSRGTILSPYQAKNPKVKDLEITLQDPGLKKKWGLKMSKASEAWKIHKTLGHNVVIAVIDTGIDVNHKDLKNNLWKNPGEMGKDSLGRDKASNGVDDDGNGKVDDVHGWNFVQNNHNLKDNHGHGTHIAGIIAAEKGNGFGVSGIAPKAQIMTLKYYDPKAPGQSNLLNTVHAINYAIDAYDKIRAAGQNLIINYSGGGLEPSQEEKKAVERARQKGILFVAAAGNERSNSDKKAYYPADYNFDNIISVTAVDKNKSVLASSNFGVQTVDIAAPGNNIHSTLPGGRFGVMTGTSQATAFVTGVAALIMSKFKDFSAKHVIDHITKTGDIVNKLQGKTRYKRVLNTYRALSILDQRVALNGVVASNVDGVNSNSFSGSQSPTPASADFGVGGLKSFKDALNKVVKESN